MSAQDGAPARRLRSLAAHIIPSAASGADGDAPKPKLLYFNSVGKCYGVRMAMFAAFGKDGWEDHRVRGGMAGDEWKELQPVLESGSLPELTLPGGEVVCQSHAIARYAGAMSRGAGHDLYPTDPGQAVLVDEIVAFAHEVLEKAPRGQEAREAFYQGGFLEKAAKLMERRLALTAGPFFGEGLTIADLCATGLCRMILTGNFDHIPPSWLAENFPRLMAMAEATDASPLVQAYYEAYADRPYMAEFKAEAEMAEAMAEATA